MTDAPRLSDANHPKATLFCPSCGHESPVAGDWIVHDDAPTSYECPECATTVTVRAIPDSPPARCPP